MELFTLHPGSGPLLINVPHAGTHVPGEIASRFTRPSQDLPDTDWFVDELYGFAGAMGASLMVATHSRYVIDLNRPPDNAPLYAQGGPGLVPLKSFRNEPIYRPDQEPDEAEVIVRRDRYWKPYHDVLEETLRLLVRRHGYAVMLDAHSIASRVPDLFEGELAAFNLGTHSGASAAEDLAQVSHKLLSGHDAHECVINGRFRGGYNTRHYGQPSERVHALQLEMSQRVYMDEANMVRNTGKMENTQRLLKPWIDYLLSWAPDQDA